VRVLNPQGQPSDEIDIEQQVKIQVEYEQLSSNQDIRPNIILSFFNEEGVCLFESFDWNNRDWAATARYPGLVRATCTIPGNLLAEGRVTVTLLVTSFDPFVRHVTVPEAVAFQAVDRMSGGGVRGRYVGDLAGATRPMFSWSVETKGSIR
jgi:hypothetical protein